MSGFLRVVSDWRFWISGPMGCVEALIVLVVYQLLAR